MIRINQYQLGDYKLFQYQILQTNITRTVWQTARRITDEIFGDLWVGEKGCWNLELTEYFHDTCLLGSCEIFEHLPKVKALSGLTPTKIMYKQVSSRQNNFFNWPLSFEEICLHHSSVTSPLSGGWVWEESGCSHMTNIWGSGFSDFILKCSWQAQQNAANYKLIPLSYLRNDVWAIDKITKIFKGADRSNKYCAIVK